MPQIRPLGEFRKPLDEACEGCAETPGMDALARAGLGISKLVAVVDMPAKGGDAVAAADFEATLVGRWA